MAIYSRRNIVLSAQGPNVLLTQPLTNGQVLVFDAQLGSFVNQPSSSLFSASNLGNGVNVFAAQQGTDFEFNSLTAGPNVQIENVNGNIQISANVSAQNNILRVADIPSRNALQNLADGALVFVNDTGTGSGQYALYMWNLSLSTWITISTEESAKTDANTYTYVLEFNSSSKIPLGYISSGHRAVEITVSVLGTFNGLNPSLSIGDDINGQSNLMDTSLTDLTQLGNYESSSNFVFEGNDTLINIYFNSGGSSVGLAKIIVSYV